MDGRQMYEVSDPSADALKAAAFAKWIYTKRVRTPEDLGKWMRSCAYHDLVAYINNTSMAIQGQRQTGGGYVISKQMLRLSEIFNWMDSLVYECHPLGVGQRLLRCVGEDKFDLLESTNSLRHKCHRAYRQWIRLMQEKLFGMLERQVEPHCKHINELAQYLTRSFGSLKSYNYGPGNELMFLFYLCGLFKAGILDGDDTVAAALLLYARYLELVRRLISFFRLSSNQMRDNSAIDDRNVLPYIWGCAQLCRSAPFAPSQWEQPGIMEAHRTDYMLLSSLEHLQKTMDAAPLGVHSYQLWCVLSLSNWPDAYAGLMGAYLKHVLNDLYTVNELIFCEMMSFTPHPLEQLQRAHLGEPPKPETSSYSDSASDSAQHTEEQEDQETHRKSQDQQQPKKAAHPPLRPHHSLDTNVFLGFQDPLQRCDPVEAEHGDSLRRRRAVQEVIARKSSTIIYPQRPVLQADPSFAAGHSDTDVYELDAMLGIRKTSNSNSSISFYSI